MEIKDIRNIIVLSLVCVLVAVYKGPSLIQYWQQSRHIFLQIDTAALQQRSPWKFFRYEKSEAEWGRLQSESTKRLVFAGQIILSGTDAIPKPAPQIIKEPIKCPAVSKPNCSVSSSSSAAALPIPAPAQQTPVTVETPNKISENKTQIIDPSPVAVETEKNIQSLESESALFSLHKGEKILLIGDSMMQGVAPHIAYIMRKKHSVESLDLGTKSTGLAYPNFFDWPAQVEEEFNKEHYAALVVLLGANDTWDMVQNNQYVKFASDLWRQLYSERIEKIVASAEARQIKVIWLSAPPMGRADLADRIPILNDIIEKTLQKHAGTVRFVNTANTLTKDGKTFTRFLDVPERGSVMVRGDDGIHFTPYGEELLAKLVISQFDFSSLATSQISAP